MIVTGFVLIRFAAAGIFVEPCAHPLFEPRLAFLGVLALFFEPHSLYPVSLSKLLVHLMRANAIFFSKPPRLCPIVLMRLKHYLLKFQLQNSKPRVVFERRDQLLE